MYVNLENTRKVSLVLVTSVLLTSVLIYGCSKNGNADGSTSLINNSAKPVPTATATVTVTTPSVQRTALEGDLTKALNDFISSSQKEDKDMRVLVATLGDEVKGQQLGGSSSKPESEFISLLKKAISERESSRREILAEISTLREQVAKIGHKGVCCNGEMMTSPRGPRQLKHQRNERSVVSTSTRTTRAKASASATVDDGTASASASARTSSAVVVTGGAVVGEHKWKDFHTDRSRCNLRNNGVIMETVFRANEAECDAWQHGRAVELGLIATQGPVTLSASPSVSVVALSSERGSTVTGSSSGSATCHFKLNGNVVAMTTAVGEAGCNSWQREEARRRGLTPK